MPDPVKTKIILRNGVETDRAGVKFSQAEPVYTTDEKRLYIGDGRTLGGIPIPNIDNNTLKYHPTAGTLGVNEDLFSSYYKKDGTDDVYFHNKVHEVVALPTDKIAIGSDANNITTGTLIGDGKINVDITSNPYTKTIKFSHESLTSGNVTRTIAPTDRIGAITVDKYGHVTGVDSVSADTVYDSDQAIAVGDGEYINSIELNRYGGVTFVKVVSADTIYDSDHAITVGPGEYINNIELNRYGKVTSVSVASVDTIYDSNQNITMGADSYINSVELNRYGQVIALTTHDIPFAPVILNTALNVTTDSADISWVTVSTNDYPCYIVAATGANFTTQTVLSSDEKDSYYNSIEHHQLTGLEPETEYYVRINDEYGDPKSNFITFTTL